MTHRETGERFGVSMRCVRRWAADELPVDDWPALAAALLKNAKTKDHVKAACRDVLNKANPKPAGPAPHIDPVAIDRSLAEELKEISAWIMKAEAGMRLAEATSDEIGFDRWDRVRRNYSDQKVKNLLAQAKLGIDSGALIGKAEIERILSAFAGRAAVSIARMRDDIAPRLVGMKNAGEAGAVLAGALWQAGYTKPFEAAQDNATFFSLPAWVVEALAKGFTDLIKDGIVPA